MPKSFEGSVLPKLREVAKALVAPGKGILAADESSKTIKTRFDDAGLEDTPENHRIYRKALFTTEGVERFISGVILFDETIRQTEEPNGEGRSLARVLSGKGIIPGIKVDGGTTKWDDGDEVITKGLEDEDAFRKRLGEYREMGAGFTKWRAVITIGEGIPTPENVEENARHLAIFARLSQEAGLVPVVEPEVLMDGTHTIERCYEVTRDTLRVVFNQLQYEGVDLQGMLLKPNMVVPGKDSVQKVSPEKVAQMTVQCLAEYVPEEVPGIVFLSGGQSDDDAIRNLSEMNRLGPHPWELSFSFGRGLQEAVYKALERTLADPAKIKAAQIAFYNVAVRCGAARFGNAA